MGTRSSSSGSSLGDAAGKTSFLFYFILFENHLRVDATLLVPNVAWPHPVLLVQPLSPSRPILDNADFLILLRMVEFASNLMIVGSNLIWVEDD